MIVWNFTLSGKADRPSYAFDFSRSGIPLVQEGDMEKYAANCMALQYLLQFAKTCNAAATNTIVIEEHFKKSVAMHPYFVAVQCIKIHIVDTVRRTLPI